MSCSYKWTPHGGRPVYLQQLKLDHLQNLARWLVKKLEEYQKVQIITGYNVPKLKIQGRLGSEWLTDVLTELQERNHV